MIDYTGLAEELFDGEIEWLSWHRDADGCFSAALLANTIGVQYLRAPVEFGDLSPKTTHVVDQVPKKATFKGVVIDHHDRHPKKHSYRLVYDTMPTTGMVFEIVKDILKEHGTYKDFAWKVVAGLMGDSGVAYVPPEVWKSTPILSSHYMNYWPQWGQDEQWGGLSLPMYKMLASGINALCRMKDKAHAAYTIAKEARSPFQVVYDEIILDAKKQQRAEIKLIMAKHKPLKLNSVIVWGFESEWRLGSYLGTMLAMRDDRHESVLMVNHTTGKLSCRGDRVGLIATTLKEEFGDRITLEGHQAYRGGNIGNVPYPELLEVLGNMNG